MANSCRKGKRGERDFCKHLQEMGYEARRSQQYQGVAVEGAGDVITSVQGVRFEVKRYKDAPRLWSKLMRDWMDQAIEETPEGKMPVIAIRGNREPWRYVYEWCGELRMMVANTNNTKWLEDEVVANDRFVRD